MPIQTDLSVSPYFDDYSENNNYYKVLFKPSVAVQVRELNQLQTILQAQVEKFGDAIFKRGSVIDGCNFTFFDTLKYVRIRDNEVDGTPVNVEVYKNLYVKDSDNLTAYVIDVDSGFESRSPDLNTLYLRYTNSGSNYSKNKFDKNNILTVYDGKFTITKALVNEGSTGFSNNDTLVIYPTIAVQNTTGGAFFAANTWVINSKIIQDTTGAEAEILAVNTTANSSVLILNIRPLETDLDDTVFDANNWTISSGYTITGATLGATTANSSANGLVVSVVGNGAQGTLLTDGTGKIIQVAVSVPGEGYYVPPHVTVASTTGAIESANIEAYNYQAKITTQNDDAATGNSYGMSVSQGVIYQKGYFSRVEEQLIVVEKYATDVTPHDKVVGFDTIESLINSDDDQSLLDNAIGAYNQTAPGADRVKLTPTLIVLDKVVADANSDFLALVEFNRGNPFKQLRGTQYSKLGVELAQRTYEESGNYVVDTFRSTTVSSNANENTSFDVVMDPGIAYILGNRVESVTDYKQTLNKGIDVKSVPGATVDINYGYYIRLNELGGYFKFNTGDVISLRSVALQYASNTSLAGTEPAAPGVEIGQARMKVLAYESGEPGSSAKYRLYIWAVQMNAGKNFADVRSIYYNGTTYKGYADIVLDAGNAQVYDNTKGQLIFDTGYNAVKSAANVSYTYRSVNAVAVANTSGVVNVTPVAGTWTYTGELTTAQESELVIVPLASMETANLGTASVGAGGNTANVTVVLANSAFGAKLSVGDYIKIYGTSTKIRKVAGVTNSTYITIDSGVGLSNATSNVSFILPKYTPIQLSTRPDRSANINGSYLRIYVNPPAAFTSGADAAVSYNAKRTAIAPTTKNTFRNCFVKLNLGTNAANTVGPWYLGVPDIFRLRAVYTSNSSTVNTNSTNITNEFFIDHGQAENSYEGGQLIKKPASTYTLTSSDYLLVRFDAYDKTGGLYTRSSYNVNDTANLATLTATSTSVHTLEIPETYTSSGKYYDLIESLDFRITANTEANIVSTATSVNITTNPVVTAYATRYNSADEKYFPIPQGDLTYDVESYQGRTDRIIVNANGDFITLSGEIGKSTAPKQPNDALTINILNIPPYPSLPKNKSGNMIELLDTNVGNIQYTNRREKDYSIVENITNGNIVFEQPVAYKMTDIASLDRRLKNIEYRIDLKDTEDNIKNKNIGSSVDAAVQRFKFGFFVDSFTSMDYSEIDDPEYSAMNFNYRMTPAKNQRNIKHRFYTANSTTAAVVTGDMVTLPYQEFSIVKQLSATAKLIPVAPVITSVANTVTGVITTTTTITNTATGTITTISTPVVDTGTGPTVVTAISTLPTTTISNTVTGTTTTGTTPDVAAANTKIAQQTAVYETESNYADYPQGGQPPDVNFTFSEVRGPVVLYMGAGGADRWEIYQSTTADFTPSPSNLLITSESSIALTDEEVNRLNSDSIQANNNYLRTWKKTIGFETKAGNTKYWITGWGKISWTHDPAKGRYYSVREIRGSPNYNWRLEYPVDASTTPLVLAGVLAKKEYNGKIIAITPKVFEVVAKVHADLGINAYIKAGTDAKGRITTDNVGNVKFSNLSNNTGLKVSDSTAGPTKISISITGLRPLTRHNFYINKVLSNSKALAKSGPESGTIGTDTESTSSLVSDITGILNVDIYYDNGFPDSIQDTTYSQLQALIKGVNANKTFAFKSSDGLSTAEYTITTTTKFTI